MAILVVAALAVSASAANAAFPNFSGCPTEVAEVTSCVDVQNTSGNLEIKGFNVPLGATSLEIRGGFSPNGTERPTFVPPAGTNGFFSRAVPVPGGLLGIEWIPGTSVLAITELAGPASSIHFNVATQEVSLPVKVRLVNTLLGMNCHIGTESSPVVLNLTTGTTSPPAPNTPITGHRAELTFVEGALVGRGIVNVENSFSVPGASSCGFGLGLINALVNLKLQLPSSGGHNSITVTNDLALRPV